MGRYERRYRDQARGLLTDHAESYLRIMLDGTVEERALVDLTCQAAQWTYESYFLATLLLDPTLVEETK